MEDIFCHLPRIEIARQRRKDNLIKDIQFPYFAERFQSSAKKNISSISNHKKPECPARHSGN